MTWEGDETSMAAGVVVVLLESKKSLRSKSSEWNHPPRWKQPSLIHGICGCWQVVGQRFRWRNCFGAVLQSGLG